MLCACWQDHVGDPADYELHNRDDLLNANREGIVSAVGYCSLHVLGVGIGRLLYSHAQETSREKGSHVTRLRASFVGVLIGLTLAAFTGYRILDSLGEQHTVSRRVGNAAFVFWTVCINLLSMQ